MKKDQKRGVFILRCSKIYSERHRGVQLFDNIGH